MASCQARWGTPERHGCEGNDTLKGLKSKELKAKTAKNRSLYIRNVTMNDFSYSMNESLGMDIPLYA